MVAIVAGNSLGTSLTSLSTIGADGQVGSAATGRSGERAFVNASNGNLVLQGMDDLFVARGPDLGVLRTYNSQGKITNGVAENWSVGTVRQKLVLPANPFQAGSVLVRVDVDGAEGSYAWDATNSRYVTRDGAGPLDTCSWVAAASQWLWTDGATGMVERYDSAGRLKSTADTDSNQTVFNYDGQGRLASWIGASQEVLTYAYEPATGDLSSISTGTLGGTLSTRTRYSYDASHRLVEVTVDLSPDDGSIGDGNVYRTRYEYYGDAGTADASQRLRSVSQTDGNRLDFEYALVGSQYRLTKVTDALGHATTYSYDTAARRTTVTDPVGIQSIYQFDTSDRLVQIDTAAPGTLATTLRKFGWDAATSDLKTVTDGLGQASTRDYDERGNLVRERDAADTTIERTFTAQNLVASETVAGATTWFLYDPEKPSQLRFVVSPLGSVTETRYAAGGFGRPTSVHVYSADTYAVVPPRYTDLVTGVVGRPCTRTDMEYDAHGQLFKSTTWASLDAAGNGVADGAQAITRYSYGTHGELLSTIDAEEAQTTYTYDGLGRLRTTLDALSRATITTYDDANGKTTLTLANGLSTTQVFDAANRLVSTTQGTSTAPDLGTLRYAYDAANRLVMTSDALDNRSFVLYDSKGRKAADVDALSVMTEYLYDAADRLTHTVTYKNTVTVALVDANGQPTNPTAAAVRPAKNSADHSRWMVYDAAGRLAKTVNAEGTVTENTYDSASLLVRTRVYAQVLPGFTSLGDTPTTDQVKPAADNLKDDITRYYYNANRQLVGTLDPEGYLVELTYDPAGRLSAREEYRRAVPVPTRGGTFAEVKSAAATGLGPTEHVVVKYTRDGMGRVQTEMDAVGNITSFTYDRMGRVRSKTLGGQTTAWDYDALGRLTRELAPDGTATGIETRYTYDAMGNLVAKLRTLSGQDTRALVSQRFDVQGRLTGELSAEGHALLVSGLSQAEVDTIWRDHGITHTYNKAGQRTSTVDARKSTTTYSYDAVGRLKARVEDSTGLILSDSYAYNGFGDVISATDSRSVKTSFTYDRLGRRLTEVRDSVTSGLKLSRKWTYDTAGNAVTSTDGNTALTYHYYDNNGRERFSVDPLGNVSETRYDQDGRVVQSSTYRTPGLAAGTPPATTQDVEALVASQVDRLVENSVYDANGRLAFTVNGAGDVVAYEYDANGNVVNQRAYAQRLSGWARGMPVVPVERPEDSVTRTQYDAANRPIWTADGRGAVTTFQYDKLGHLTGSTAYVNTVNPTAAEGALPLGAANDCVTRNTYDINGRLEYSADGTGAVTRRLYDPNGNLTQIIQYATPVGPTQDLAAVATSTYDRVTNYGYDAVNRVTTVVEANGAVTQRVYDKNGNLTQETRRARMVAAPVAGAPSIPAKFTADTQDRVTRMAYDAADRLVFVVDATGTVTENVYDGVGHVTATITYATTLTDLAATGLGTKPLVADVRAALTSDQARDRRKEASFDATGRLVEARDVFFDGSATTSVHKTAYSYNGADELKSSEEFGVPIAPRFRQFKYDAAGNLTWDSNGLGARKEYTYNGTGDKLSLQNEKGDVWTYDYDAARNQVRETSPAISWTRVDEATQSVTTRTEPIVTLLEYDGRGNLTRRTEAAGTSVERSTQYAYDAMGRQVMTIFAPSMVYAEAASSLTTNGFGATEAARAERAVTTWTETRYDAFGNAVECIDMSARWTESSGVQATESGRSSYKIYDRLGRLTHEVDALMGVTRYQRNAFGDATSLTRLAAPATCIDAKAGIIDVASTAGVDRTISTSYDRMGRVLSVKEPSVLTFDAETPALPSFAASRTSTYTYNAFGETLRVSRVKGSTALDEFREYDQFGHVTGVWSGGYLTASEYDSAGNLTKVTEFATKVSPPPGAGVTLPRPQADLTADRITTFTYDSAGQKLSETRENLEYSDPTASSLTSSRGTQTTAYLYDAVGNVVSVTNEAGTTYTYYDRLGRVTATVAPAGSGDGGVARSAAIAYQRDAHGNAVVQTQFANAVNSAGRFSYEVSADPTNDRVTYTDYGNTAHARASLDANGAKHSFSYDKFGRIAKEWQRVGSGDAGATLFKAYAYDAVGRVVSVIEPATTSYVDGNNVVQVRSQQLAGVVTNDTRYNVFGDVTGRGVNGVFDETFDYDVAGRLWRTNSGDGVDRIYLYDQLGNAVSELRSTGTQNLRAAGVTPTSANQDATLRRVDTRYDALGHVIQTTQAARDEKLSGVTVRSTRVTASVTDSGTRLRESPNLAWTWVGAQIDLHWDDLSSLGAGEVKVEVDYIDRTYVNNTYVAGKAASLTCVSTSEAMATGGSISLAETSGDYGGIDHINAVHVYKKDVGGRWVQVCDLQWTGNCVDVDRKADAVAERIEIWDAPSGMWKTVDQGISDFGGRYRFDFRTYDPAQVTFRLMGPNVDPLVGPTSLAQLGYLAPQSTTATFRPVMTQTVDRWGNVTSITDPRNPKWITQYRYNANNQVVEQFQTFQSDPTVAPALRRTATVHYDLVGRQVGVTDANGRTNRQRYDTQGNLVREDHADGGVVNHTYNIFGNRTRTLDAESNLIRFAYDKLNHQTRMERWGRQRVDLTTAGFNVESVALVNGTPVATTAHADSLSEITQWDEAGRRISEESGRTSSASGVTAGQVTRYDIDLRGNILKTTAPGGVVVSRAAFNTRDRKTAETDAKSRTGTWSYNAFGKLLSHRDLAGSLHTFTYDRAWQLTQHSTGSGTNMPVKLTYSYDSAGQLLKVEDNGITNGQPNNQQTYYSYDLGGRRTGEKTVAGGAVYQDTHNNYDSLGRLTWVGDDHAMVRMDYDDAGNRTRVQTYVVNAGTDGRQSVVASDRYFKYDAMGRQTLVDGVDAAGNINAAQGHRLTYDKNGNRKSDTFVGAKVSATVSTFASSYDQNTNEFSYNTFTDYTTSTGETTETYEYDGAKRLASIARDGVQVDQRFYDAQDRVLKTGMSGTTPMAFLKALYGTDASGNVKPGNGAEQRINLFDDKGRLQQTRVLKADGSLSHDLVNTSIDILGNVLGYTVKPGSGSATVYTRAFTTFDSDKEVFVKGTNPDMQPGQSTTTYDSNGNIRSVSGALSGDRSFITSPDGQVLASIESTGEIVRQLMVNGEMLGTYGAGKDPNAPAAANPSISSFEFGYRPISPNYPLASPGLYTVQTSDTLRSIAQRAYGDSSRWYEIAEANGLGSDADLKVGQSLNVPSSVGGAANSAGTFQPYDPSEAVGDTSPLLVANVPPPPKEACGGYGQFIMMVVAIAVTAMTQGATAEWIGEAMVSQGAAAEGLLATPVAAGGVEVGGFTYSSSALAQIGSGVVSNAVGAVAGSIAGQMAGNALGIQNGFSWKQVGLSALSAGIGSALGGVDFTGSGTTGTAGNIVLRSAVGNALTQALGVATGLQRSFSWRGVAASAVGAGVGYEVGARVGLNDSNFAEKYSFGEQVGRRFATGIAAGVSAAVARGGKVAVMQVAADAFGNALGESIADASQPVGRNEFDLGGAPDESTAEAAWLGRSANAWAESTANMYKETPGAVDDASSSTRHLRDALYGWSTGNDGLGFRLEAGVGIAGMRHEGERAPMFDDTRLFSDSDDPTALVSNLGRDGRPVVQVLPVPGAGVGGGGAVGGGYDVVRPRGAGTTPPYDLPRDLPAGAPGYSQANPSLGLGAPAKLADTRSWLDFTNPGLPLPVRALGGLLDNFIFKSPSQKLGEALEAAGYERPVDSAAHHIVPWKDLRAADIRRRLEEWDIGIDSASNGVFLPQRPNSQAPGAYHPQLNNDEYYDQLREDFRRVNTRQRALDVLSDIRGQLLNGTYPGSRPVPTTR